jgi:hypothetical protein
LVDARDRAETRLLPRAQQHDIARGPDARAPSGSAAVCRQSRARGKRFEQRREYSARRGLSVGVAQNNEQRDAKRDGEADRRHVAHDARFGTARRKRKAEHDAACLLRTYFHRRACRTD